MGVPQHNTPLSQRKWLELSFEWTRILRLLNGDMPNAEKDRATPNYTEVDNWSATLVFEVCLELLWITPISRKLRNLVNLALHSTILAFIAHWFLAHGDYQTTHQPYDNSPANARGKNANSHWAMAACVRRMSLQTQNNFPTSQQEHFDFGIRLMRPC